MVHFKAPFVTVKNTELVQMTTIVLIGYYVTTICHSFRIAVTYDDIFDDVYSILYLKFSLELVPDKVYGSFRLHSMEQL